MPISDNNPGNIKIVWDQNGNPSTPWQGALPPKIPNPNNPNAKKPVFVHFNSAHNGLRAMSRVLHTKYHKDGLTNITQIIKSYAPKGIDHNHTQHYIAYVSKHAHLGRTQKIDINSKDQVRKILRAMVSFENGHDPYTKPQYNRAIEASLGQSTAANTPTPPKQKTGQKVQNPLNIYDPSVNTPTTNARLSPTNEAKYCFVNQCFSHNLQELLLQYSALANNYNAEYR